MTFLETLHIFYTSHRNNIHDTQSEGYVLTNILVASIESGH